MIQVLRYARYVIKHIILIIKHKNVINKSTYEYIYTVYPADKRNFTLSMDVNHKV